MSRRSWLWAGIIVALIGVGVALFLALFERTTTTVTLPPTGEARFNPLYALRATLRAQGIDAQSQAVFNPNLLVLRPGDTLVIYTQPESITAQQTQRLLAWVRSGGHLVMPGPGPGETPGALSEALGLSAAQEAMDPGDDDEDAWDASVDCTRLGATPVSTKETAKATSAAPATGDAPARELVHLCGARFVGSLPQFRGHHGDSVHGYRFGRIALDDGLVTVVSDLDFLGNALLERRIATDLAFQVLAPRLGRGKVHLVYSADVPSLWRLLVLHGWRVLLPAGLGLLAWLLWRGQRLGSQVPPPPADRRALLEHVRAAGEFAFRRGRSLALHTAVLAMFKRRLALRDPVLAALDGPAQVAALAERFGLSPERVRSALQPVGLQRPDVFLHSVSTLVLMRNRL